MSEVENQGQPDSSENDSLGRPKRQLRTLVIEDEPDHREQATGRN